MPGKLARDVRVYEVGGAVRDALLGRAIADRDFVVVGATPEMMMASGYRPVGNDFPVFLHPDTHEEHALARTERKHGTGYRGFEFFASPDVTLEEDLARRDLTINAMARDESGTIIDPFNGRDDLARGILRHVSPAFAEDPLRVLRVARFAARFGFRVAPATRTLMKRIAASGELATISPERVWRELAIGLAEATPSRMIEVLRGCDALAPLLPEVDALFGVPAVDDALARPRGAAKDAGLRMLQALDRTAADRGDLPVRYATMVQTLGAAASATAITSGALARASARHADALSARLKAPLECRDAGRLAALYRASAQQGAALAPARLLDLVQGCDALRRPQRLTTVLGAAKADACAGGRGQCAFPQADEIEAARAAIAGVDAGAVARSVARGDRGVERADDVRRAIRRARLAALARWKRERRAVTGA